MAVLLSFAANRFLLQKLGDLRTVFRQMKDYSGQRVSTIPFFSVRNQQELEICESDTSQGPFKDSSHFPDATSANNRDKLAKFISIYDNLHNY